MKIWKYKTLQTKKDPKTTKDIIQKMELRIEVIKRENMERDLKKKENLRPDRNKKNNGKDKLKKDKD